MPDEDSPRAAIMDATFRALAKHGYADLTVQAIADEFAKSKSLIYHHYDGKDDLLLELLSFLLERYEERIPFPRDETEREYLETVLDRILAAPGSTDYREYAGAMAELRAQAAHDPEYRAHFTESDRFFRKQFARVVRSGVDHGEFRDVDAEAVAATLHASIVGAATQRATTEDDLAASVRAELDRYLRQCVYAEEAVDDETGETTFVTDELEERDVPGEDEQAQRRDGQDDGECRVPWDAEDEPDGATHESPVSTPKRQSKADTRSLPLAHSWRMLVIVA